MVSNFDVGVGVTVVLALVLERRIRPWCWLGIGDVLRDPLGAEFGDKLRARDGPAS